MLGDRIELKHKFLYFRGNIAKIYFYIMQKSTLAFHINLLLLLENFFLLFAKFFLTKIKKIIEKI
jgi:hypothetical protein